MTIPRYLVWLVPVLGIGLVALAIFPFVDADRSGGEEETWAGLSSGGLAEVNGEGLEIALTVEPRTYALLERVENRETFTDRAVNAVIGFGDLPPRQAVLKLRGRGSLRMDDASPNYTISLMRAEEFAPGVRMKRFYLMNMSYDRAQWELHFSYTLLQRLDLFPPHFQFVRVTMNDRPQGMFLLVEPPEGAIRRQFPDCVNIYRRRESNRYDTVWTGAAPSVEASLRRFRALNRSRPAEAGAYAEILDLPAYYRWLSVNSVLGNGDTLDELFLYERRADPNVAGTFHVMAWDFDDIGRGSRLKSLDDPLLHSSMDAFEKILQGDPQLYTGFRNTLRTLLAGELSMENLIARLRETRKLRESLEPGESKTIREERARSIEAMERFLEKRHRTLAKALAE